MKKRTSIIAIMMATLLCGSIFAAHAGISGTAGTPGGLFTLKTKHLICHNISLLSIVSMKGFSHVSIQIIV